MLEKLIKLKNRNREEESNLISFQLAEASEISDLLIERIQQKINLLKEFESSIDKKIIILEKLLERAEKIRIPSTSRTDRYDEILYLKNKGFKTDEISKLLDVPIGEVELFLQLKKDKL